MKKNTVAVWPVYLLALPAFVAIWSGWVGLGQMAGFGPVELLPGIADFKLNTAITLPIGMETYAAYALRVWMSGRVPARARRFARVSAVSSLAVGALGQVAYHLMVAAGWASAPWPIVILVSCIPVAVLGMGAGLAHMIREGDSTDQVGVPGDQDGDQAAPVSPGRGPVYWPVPTTEEMYERYGVPVGEQADDLGTRGDQDDDQAPDRPLDDDRLFAEHGDELRTLRDRGELTRGAVERICKVYRRQAQRLKTRIENEADQADQVGAEEVRP